MTTASETTESSFFMQGICTIYATEALVNEDDIKVTVHFSGIDKANGNAHSTAAYRKFVETVVDSRKLYSTGLLVISRYLSGSSLSDLIPVGATNRLKPYVFQAFDGCRRVRCEKRRRTMTALRYFCWLALAVGAVSFASQSAIAADPWFAPTTIKITTESVVFSNAGATLRGTLYLPANARNVPAVVVLHGASEPLADTPLYRHLREGLPAIGIAVLLFDRRGSGASSGSTNVGYETFAQDAIAGARLLRQMPAIDASRVGYWGISQGGWLAAYAAALDPATAFVIAVSAPLVTAEAQMEFAMSNQLEVLGYGQSAVIEMLAARKALDGYFNGSNSRAAAVAAIKKIEKKPWFDLMYLPTSEAVPKSPTDGAWRGKMDKDPIAAVARVEAPTLFILGGEDPWIPVQLTVEHLRALAQSNPRVQYVVVPNADHLMRTPPSRKSETMSDADPRAVLVDAPESATYFILLAAWLQRQLQLRDSPGP